MLVHSFGVPGKQTAEIGVAGRVLRQQRQRAAEARVQLRAQRGVEGVAFTFFDSRDVVRHPLVQALDILAEQTENKALKEVTRSVVYDVESGHTLADALRKHPKAFTELYVNMVAAGEAGGILDTILLRLATFLEKNDALVRKVKGAMVYPGVIMSVAAAAIAILLIDISPTITSDGGGASASVSVAENSAAVTTVTATDVSHDALAVAQANADRLGQSVTHRGNQDYHQGEMCESKMIEVQQHGNDHRQSGQREFIPVSRKAHDEPNHQREDDVELLLHRQ